MKKYLIFLFCFFTYCALFAIPTKVIVRAKAKDAKFIGSSIGGAKVIIRNALTGQVMAEGMTSGSTGNTNLIMKEAHNRHTKLADESTAKFETTLDIEEPVLATVEVYAPFNQKNATVHAQTQLWLIPGKDITGDGIILEIPGFIVNVLNPQTHESIAAKNAIALKANVVMMCGCTISNGGLWDAQKYEVKALIKKDGKLISAVPLLVKDKVNTFEGTFKPEGHGLYEITVYAYDAQTGNTGVDRVNFIIE